MLPDGHGRDAEIDKQAQNDSELLNHSMIDKATKVVTNNKPASDLWPQFRGFRLSEKGSQNP
jgi:hypothetical protein